MWQEEMQSTAHISDLTIVFISHAVGDLLNVRELSIALQHCKSLGNLPARQMFMVSVHSR